LKELSVCSTDKQTPISITKVRLLAVIKEVKLMMTNNANSNMLELDKVNQLQVKNNNNVSKQAEMVRDLKVSTCSRTNKSINNKEQTSKVEMMRELRESESNNSNNK